MRVEYKWWTEKVIINLRKEGISDFDSLKDVKWEMFDKRYLVLSLELMRKIVKDEDTEGEKP